MPTTEYATGTALLTGPLTYAAGLFLFGLVVVLLAAIGQAAIRFQRTQGAAPVAALLRAVPYVLIGGPIRFARQRANMADLTFGRIRTTASIHPDVLARVAASRPATTSARYRSDVDLAA